MPQISQPFSFHGPTRTSNRARNLSGAAAKKHRHRLWIEPDLLSLGSPGEAGAASRCRATILAALIHGQLVRKFSAHSTAVVSQRTISSARQTHSASSIVLLIGRCPNWLAEIILTKTSREDFGYAHARRTETPMGVRTRTMGRLLWTGLWGCCFGGPWRRPLALNLHCMGGQGEAAWLCIATIRRVRRGFTTSITHPFKKARRRTPQKART